MSGKGKGIYLFTGFLVAYVHVFLFKCLFVTTGKGHLIHHKNRRTRSQMAGVQFPVGRLHRMLKKGKTCFPCMVHFADHLVI